MSQPQSREIRVFLSSTFRDMEAERAHLIKAIFPRVRAACRARQVGFTEIDLRWGVTEEESKNGATVEICLKEIDRCRDFPPFFIGFMGERYGWIPRDEDLTAYWNRHSDSPYAAAIKDAVKRGISVTELEMELAVFGNAVTPPAFKPGEVADGRALFLLRDPALSETLYAAARERGGARETDFIDTGDGKLQILKDRIRNSGLLAVDNYHSIEAFGQQIETHLLAALDRYFPEGDIPTEQERIDAVHAAFRYHRLQNFLPRPDIRSQVLDAVLKRYETPALGPVVLGGPSGQGKSALMADLARFVERNPVHHGVRFEVIDHYVGADGRLSLEQWIERILNRLHPAIEDLTGPLPEDSKDQADALVTWLAYSARRKEQALGEEGAPFRYLLLLDAVDQLSDGGANLELLDKVGADGIVILSTADGTPAHQTTERWGRIEVTPLGDSMRTLMIRDTLERYRKSLPEEDARKLASAPQSGSPLFLSLALEELRLDAHHETLSTLVDDILQAPDAQTLLLNNFLLDPDYSRDGQPDLAVRFMALLGAAREGLTEQHLAELLALPDDPVAEDSGKPRLPQASLSHLLNSFGGFLLNKGDRRAPMHRIFGEAALAHLGETQVREQLYDVFHAVADQSDEYKAEALYQLTWLAERTESSRERWRAGLLDAIEAWISIGYGAVLASALGLLDENEKEELTVRWENTCSTLPDNDLENLAEQWRSDMGWLQEITFNQYKTSVRVVEALLSRLKSWNGQHDVTLSAMYSLGGHYCSVGRYQDAHVLESQVLKERQRVLGDEHLDTLTAMGALSGTKQSLGEYAEARELNETVLEARRRLLDPEHPDTLLAMNNLARTLSDQGDYAGARELEETVLEARRRLLGPEHPDTLLAMNNLALTLSDQGDYAGARELEETVLEARRRTLGPEHPHTLTSMNNLARTLSDQGDYAGARALFLERLLILENIHGLNSKEVAGALWSLAKILLESPESDHQSEAIDMLRRELAITEINDGVESEGVAHSCFGFGQILVKTGEPENHEEGLMLMQRALVIAKAIHGEHSEQVASILGTLADTHSANDKLGEAISLRQQQLDILESIYGDEDNEDVANGLHSLALDMRNADLLEEALPLQEKALAMFKNLDGENSKNAAYANSALGWLHHLRGDDALARPYLEKAVSIRVELFGEDHPSTNTAKDRLSALSPPTQG